MEGHITFSGRFHYRKGGGVLRHQHVSDYQLQLIYSGEAEILINDNRIKAKKGDLVLVKKNDFHSFTVLSSSGMDTLEMKFIADNEELSSLIDKFSNIITDDGEFFRLFSEIVVEGQYKHLRYKEMSTILLQRCLILMERENFGDKGYNPLSNNIPTQQNHKNSPVVAAVTEYIYRNLDKKITMYDIATGSGYNRDYLYRIIRKELGISTVNYVNKIKLSEAKKMIQHTELSISEIAWNLGYESIQYFSRLFKEETGMSPSDYSATIKNTIRTDY